MTILTAQQLRQNLFVFAVKHFRRLIRISVYSRPQMNSYFGTLQKMAEEICSEEISQNKDPIDKENKINHYFALYRCLTTNR